MADNLSKKQRRWLERINQASQPTSQMYVGEREDFVPGKIANALYKAGFILLNYPHNPAHKGRWVITTEGRAALEASDA